MVSEGKVVHSLELANDVPIGVDPLAAQRAPVTEGEFHTFDGDLGGEGEPQEGPQQAGDLPAIPHAGQQNLAAAKVELALGDGLLAALPFMVNDHGLGHVPDGVM
ncbi:MAG: hypothetical protein WCG26_16415, partial [Chloroflexales bacterium]